LTDVNKSFGKENNKMKTLHNSTYPQAGISCFVGQESSKFGVQCFVESSLKNPAFGQLQTGIAHFDTRTARQSQNKY
jgi:hypothetical protein